MKKMMLGLMALTAAVLILPAPAQAIVGTSTHGYDELNTGVPVGASQAGFAYTGATALCVPTYNYFGYPPSPQSPRCVWYAPSGTVNVAATDPAHWFTRVTGYCSTAAPFVNPNGIAIEATDILGGVARATCKGNYAAPGGTFSLSAALPSASLRIHDTGNYYVVDHLVFSSLI